MLKIDNISFSYKEIPTLIDINFVANNGDNIAIIGESGCGKSTLLKLIYGIYDLNEGEILYENNKILGPSQRLIPGEDYIKYLAQDFGLMPYITVAENVGKYLSNVDKTKKNNRITQLLKLVEMEAFAATKAQYLSGGQQQRVALAMVLAHEPKVLLLDEPFSQIDNFRKNNLRRNLFQYLKSNKITCIMATHDCNDALSFSDKLIVLRDGKIIANDNPKTIFENPESKYIGALFGEINEIDSKYLSNENKSNKIKLVYSFQLKIVKKSNLKVKIVNNYFRGTYYLIEAKHDLKSLFFNSDLSLKEGTFVYLELQANS